MNLTGCSTKEVEYVDRYYMVEYQVQALPHPEEYCLERNFPVIFEKCDDEYCLSDLYARRLIVNVKSMQSCLGDYKDWVDDMCDKEEIVCAGEDYKEIEIKEIPEPESRNDLKEIEDKDLKRLSIIENIKKKIEESDKVEKVKEILS